jgi:MoaA/NifB/PqqE/SkfB family radical SAM enzyme
MEFLERVRNMAPEQIERTILDMATSASNDSLIQMVMMASQLVDGQIARQAVKAITANLARGEEDQTVRILKRIIAEVSPECLRTLGRSLFINGLLRSSVIRADFNRRHGFAPPFTMLISPTSLCNLNCKGCYAAGYVRRKGLPYDLLDRILSEAHEMGIFFILLTGGEPLVRKDDLFHLFEKHSDMFFMFFTNGTLVDDAVVHDLHRLGNTAPILSLEGFEKATDERRGKGVYGQVMNAMDVLKAKGVPFGTALTVTRHNIEEVTCDQFFGHLHKKGVLIAWLFLFMPMGPDSDASLMPTPEQRRYLGERGIALREKYPIFIFDFKNDAHRVGGCRAGGYNYFHINPNGDVEPCVFAHFAVDNIHEKSLLEVLTSDFFRGIRDRQPYSDNPLTPCMIIDSPHVFRDVVQSCAAYPTHSDARSGLERTQNYIKDYSERLKAIYDPIWEEQKRRQHCS